MAALGGGAAGPAVHWHASAGMHGSTGKHGPMGSQPGTAGQLGAGATRHWLLARLGVDEHTPESRLCEALGDSALPVVSEDVVMAAVASLTHLGCRHTSIWYCIRFAFLSPHACDLLETAVGAMCDRSLHSPLHVPASLTAHIARQLFVRSKRQAAARSSGPGSLVEESLEIPTEDTPLQSDSLVATLTSRAAFPRHSYAFSTDVHGTSHLGGGIGMFFVWLDPKEPLRPNRASHEAELNTSDEVDVHPLPGKYAANIRAWSAAYGRRVSVFSGLQCALAVREASMHAEFNFAAAAPMTAADAPSLWEVYLRFARDPAAWIRCADIARLAILWLCGRGSMYLDTDMKPASHSMPLAFVAPQSPPRLQPETLTSQLPTSLDPAPNLRLATLPLLMLPQDADGTLQNNVIAATASFHPLLTLCLRAVLTSSLHEGHVIHSTGPAIITAVYYAFRNARVASSASNLYSAYNAVVNEPYIDAFAASDHSVGAACVPAHDNVHRDTRAALPAPLPDTTFPFLRRIPAARHAPARPHLDASPAIPTGWRRIDDFFLSDTVHICPPHAFFPRHWRDSPAGMSDSIAKSSPAHASLSASINTLKAGAVTSPSGSAALPALAPARPASFWHPSLPSISEDSSAHGAAKTLRERLHERGKQDVSRRGKAGAGTSPLVPAGLRPPPAASTSAPLRLAAHAATSLTSDVRFGEHAWDCTWGRTDAATYVSATALAGAPVAAGGYGYTAAYAYGAAYGYFAGVLKSSEPAARQRSAAGPTVDELEAMPQSQRLRSYLSASGPNLLATWHGEDGDEDSSASHHAEDPFASPHGNHVVPASDNHHAAPSDDVFGVVDLAARVSGRMSELGW